MIDTLNPLLSFGFSLTVLLTILLFAKSTPYFVRVLAIVLVWSVSQSVIALIGFYTVTDTLPPRMLLLLAPPMLTMITLFVLPVGRSFLLSLDLKWLTGLHTIRIAVELVLWALFLATVIPERMTFEGLNFDVIAGLTAPVVYYLVFQIRIKRSRKLLLLWNVASLALLLNIVFNGILSAPSPFQQFAFDQPNIALLYFPFNLLPAVVVPIVLLSHLAAIFQLTRSKTHHTIAAAPQV